jgi:uncharacterized coiled-coil DUF342 family protein
MSEDQFTKLFKEVQSVRKDMNHRFDEASKDRDDIKGAVAELAGQIRDYHQEMIMLTRKVDRMERWIHEIAKKTGVELSFEG